ncbi:MAG: prepilin-type N-terminal cleavage/methylation domain-containing protein [Candidatus Saccharibacteria bacterium]
MTKSINKSEGFTIVELLVVIVVIGVLAAITIVSYTGITKKANSSAIAGNVDMIKSAAEAYNSEKSEYPLTAAVLLAGGTYSKLSSSINLVTRGITWTSIVSPVASTDNISSANNTNTVSYIGNPGKTGGCITYYNTDAVVTTFVGAATALGALNASGVSTANATPIMPAAVGTVNYTCI